jgi:hypothetical protein
MAFKADISTMLFFAIAIFATKKPQSFDAVSLAFSAYIIMADNLKKQSINGSFSK